VFKVIANPPGNGLSKEFLEKWNIHVVCCSPEYDKEGDHYYKVPRELGMIRVLPRTEGVSTSDLIKRVQKYGTESKQVFVK
jgi:glycerol-3-phosphate cytidylyltransferase-like family protein